MRDTRACPPGHLITHIFFCALSRYGVTTVRSFPHADFSGIRDVCSDQNRLFRAESVRCLRPMPLTSSFFHDSECFVPLDFPRRCPLPLFPKRPCGRPGQRRSGFADISRYSFFLRILQSRYHDFAPGPTNGPRYQTAGSIGALARDEPVTPGVTFLSPPAPNSEDLEDR